MQSTNERKRYTRMNEFASTARQREVKRSTLKTAMAGGAGLGTVLLLLFAIVGVIVFGGGHEVVSAPKAETSIAEVAAILADTGGAVRNEKASSGAATPSDYFPADFVNRGRDGDGNVMTYEHD